MRAKSIVFSLLILCGSAPGAHAADPCAGFKWDLKRELALFRGPAAVLAAGKSVSAAPALSTNRLYRLSLVAQSQVAFASPPGKATPAEEAYAGLAVLKVPKPGNYRIAVDVPFWIDVVADGKLAAVTDFQGQQSCDAPHKIVEFELRDATRFILQISGSMKPVVRVTVTAAVASGL